VRHGEANKRQGSAIGLTRDRLVVEVRPGRSPASGGGEAEATRPRRLDGIEDRGGAQQCVARAASMCPREGARWVPGLGGSAEERARQWRSGGGRGSSGSGEQVVWLGPHMGLQARCVRGEGLDVLRWPGKWTGR
jgi:hypothetical protein